MKELIRVRVQYASRQQCCKTHKRPLPLPFSVCYVSIPLINTLKYSCTKICFISTNCGLLYRKKKSLSCFRSKNVGERIWTSRTRDIMSYLLLISSFRRVLYVVCFLLGSYPASGFYMPTFRNTLFHLHRQVDVSTHIPACEDGTARVFRNVGI